MITDKRTFGLSGNWLKIIAAITMFIDHFGLILFPKIKIFRIIGRLAFPIFAFLIAEGAKYTKNRLKYFLQIVFVGAVCTAVQFAVQNRIYLNVLITFSLSLLIIYSLQEIKKALVLDQKPLKAALFSLCFIAAIALAWTVDYFYILDYDFWGVLLAVFASLFHSVKGQKAGVLTALDNKYLSVILMLIPMLNIMQSWSLQVYSLLALPLLLLYTGKRGRYNMKYFFYIFYPLHIAVLYGVNYFFF